MDVQTEHASTESSDESRAESAQTSSESLVDAIDELRRRVEARKQSGEYPTDLDSRLESLAAMAKTRIANTVLDPAFARLERASRMGRQRIDYASRMRLGSMFHKLVGRLVKRQTDGILKQIQEYADAVQEVLVTMAESLGRRETLGGVSHRVDLLMDRLAQYERVGRDKPGVAAIAAEMKELRTAIAKRDFAPWYSQAQFEAFFRGTREEILESLRSLAPHFGGCSPVLDFGCGRGEMLELLGELGVEAHGVELDAALVEDVTRRGLSAEVGDGMAYLRGCPDGSLGGIFLGQVIEHLTSQDALDLIALASIKLRQSGRLIIETVNNQSLYVFSHSFYVDPTHVRPVPPQYLLFLVQQAGFTEWGIDWRSPVGHPERLEPLPTSSLPEAELVERLNRNLERLNESLFAPQDYALIATR